MATITIDGAAYDIPCSVSRRARVRTSENSGYLMDGKYFNDALATYLEYDVQLAVPKGMEAKYAALFDAISAPSSEHSFTLPYGQSTVTFKGRVEEASDSYYRREGSAAIWRGASFTVTANEPYKKAAQSLKA